MPFFGIHTRFLLRAPDPRAFPARFSRLPPNVLAPYGAPDVVTTLRDVCSGIDLNKCFTSGDHRTFSMGLSSLLVTGAKRPFQTSLDLDICKVNHRICECLERRRYFQPVNLPPSSSLPPGTVQVSPPPIFSPPQALPPGLDVSFQDAHATSFRELSVLRSSWILAQRTVNETRGGGTNIGREGAKGVGVVMVIHAARGKQDAVESRRNLCRG